MVAGSALGESKPGNRDGGGGGGGGGVWMDTWIPGPGYLDLDTSGADAASYKAAGKGNHGTTASGRFAA